jgi:hypothetical protein
MAAGLGEMPVVAVQFLGAGLLVACAWLGLRRACSATLRSTALVLLLLDVLPMLCVWLVIAALTARPVLAGVIVAAMAYGLVRGNLAKRAASSEPLIFTDGLLGSIFFYPSLYAEFVTPPVLLRAIAATLCGFALLGWLEPVLWKSVWVGLVPVAVVGAGLIWLLRSNVLRWVLQQEGIPAVSGAPEADSAAFGPMASIIVHTATARWERVARQRDRSPGRSDSLPASFNPSGPVVLLQLESFFDARRLGDFVPNDLLPNFDRCVARSICHGEMEAPAYGANTVRTEFAALTGIRESVLGLDRFNPYASYARVPIDSIAWRMRQAGFRTVCLHPFAGSFYGRRHVMPNLGFDEFLDIRAFSAYDRGQTYISDLTVIREIERVLAESGPRTFIFAITMGNHSPWKRPLVGAPPNLPRGVAFARFLAGLAETDAALGTMTELMNRKWRNGMFAAFGDHLPSFPGLYRKLGYTSRATDYLVWQADQALGERRDIRADELPGLLLRAADRSQVAQRLRGAKIAVVQS